MNCTTMNCTTAAARRRYRKAYCNTTKLRAPPEARRYRTLRERQEALVSEPRVCAKVSATGLRVRLLPGRHLSPGLGACLGCLRRLRHRSSEQCPTHSCRSCNGTVDTDRSHISAISPPTTSYADWRSPRRCAGHSPRRTWQPPRKGPRQCVVSIDQDGKSAQAVLICHIQPLGWSVRHSGPADDTSRCGDAQRYVICEIATHQRDPSYTTRVRRRVTHWRVRSSASSDSQIPPPPAPTSLARFRTSRGTPLAPPT